jgi:hypothetical protein
MLFYSTSSFIPVVMFCMPNGVWKFMEKGTYRTLPVFMRSHESSIQLLLPFSALQRGGGGDQKITFVDSAQRDTIMLTN